MKSSVVELMINFLLRRSKINDIQRTPNSFVIKLRIFHNKSVDHD